MATTAKPGLPPRPSSSTGAFATSRSAANTGVISGDQLSPDASSFPVIYEAAILYAANHNDAARDILKDHMKTDEGKSSIRTWL
ncbi:MAG: hypothetical protein ABL931_20410, partial [Usitatibacteraceae bacterium]